MYLWQHIVSITADCDRDALVIEVVKEGAGELVCCNQPMELMTLQRTQNEKFEYHVPFVIEHEDCNEVQVGEKPHPMTQEHHIEFIEIYTKDNTKILRKYLAPDEHPSVKVPKCFDIGRAVALCNLHGLWEKP